MGEQRMPDANLVRDRLPAMLKGQPSREASWSGDSSRRFHDVYVPTLPLVALVTGGLIALVAGQPSGALLSAAAIAGFSLSGST